MRQFLGRDVTTAKPAASKTPPVRPLTLGVVLVLALFLCGAWITGRSYTDLHVMVKQELELRFLSGQLLALHEQLSNSARLAAETGAPEWEARYRKTEPEFESALRQAVAAAPADSMITSPIWAASAALAATESAAFSQLHRGHRAAALSLLSSHEYEQRRTIYVDGLNKLSANMLEQAQKRLALQRQWVMAAALLGLALLGALGAAWAWISGLVQHYLREVEAADRQLADHNQQLELRVQARTAELSVLNQQLRDEMEQRSRMEAELRQAQKLEAIGRLAAGVAHEINTPVQFVSDNCHFLRQGTGDAVRLMERYRQAINDVADGTMPADEARRMLADTWESADADFLSKNLSPAAGRALEGLDRVSQIVRSMKEFSHPGTRQRTRVDLNRAIQSTLTIASNETRYVADVLTDFGDIPEVYCFPSELNQVILNLVVNAAHAIGNANQGTDRRGRIMVSTRSWGADVLISVRDDGCGIPEDIRDRIFEPFFTTKDVGEGTGQGLAIARAIVVDQHRGKIEVESEVGRGSIFSIWLPADQRSDRPEAITI